MQPLLSSLSTIFLCFTACASNQFIYPIFHPNLRIIPINLKQIIFIVKCAIMKHLNGYKKRYFSLAVIAMYSTFHKLEKVESSLIYHLKALEYQEYKTSPPLLSHRFL